MRVGFGLDPVQPGPLQQPLGQDTPCLIPSFRLAAEVREIFNLQHAHRVLAARDLPAGLQPDDLGDDGLGDRQHD
jgi:hypothetical protein